MPKNVRLNFMHHFIMKNPDEEELQNIAFNHSSDMTLETLWIFTKNVQ